MTALPSPTLRRLPAAAAFAACAALAAAMLAGAGGTPVPASALGSLAALLLVIEVVRRAVQMLRSGFGVPLVLAVLGSAVVAAGWSIIVGFHAEYLAAVLVFGIVGAALVVRPIIEARQHLAAGASPWQALAGRAVDGPVAAGTLRTTGTLLVGLLLLLLAARILIDAITRSTSLASAAVVAFGLMAMAGAAAAGWFARAASPSRVSVGGALSPPTLVSTEREEQVVAAHLHDSVLQTLALIQRSTSDPARVGQLARQQERSLRAWLAGRDEASASTLPGALRAAAQAVEDEHPGAVIEVVIVGNAPLDRSADAMVRAAREAMRNAVRHAGSPVRVFLEIEGSRRELFVRDTGSGFTLDAIDEARRGVRDAIIGRMEHVGGTAEIESGPTGTDVILRSEHSGATPDDPFGGRT